MTQIIRVVVEDKPGALMRVAGILTGTGSNIERLILEPISSQVGASSITIAVDIEPRLRDRVIQQINRLVNVFTAEDITEVNEDTV